MLSVSPSPGNITIHSRSNKREKTKKKHTHIHTHNYSQDKNPCIKSRFTTDAARMSFPPCSRLRRSIVELVPVVGHDELVAIWRWVIVDVEKQNTHTRLRDSANSATKTPQMFTEWKSYYYDRWDIAREHIQTKVSFCHKFSRNFQWYQKTNRERVKSEIILNILSACSKQTCPSFEVASVGFELGTLDRECYTLNRFKHHATL